MVEGLTLVSRKRREHLTAEDIKKNKSFLQSLTSGSAVTDDDYKVIMSILFAFFHSLTEFFEKVRLCYPKQVF